MLTIRLQRTGTKNSPKYRVVVAEKTAHVSKKFAEVLGSYDPKNKQLSMKNADRLNYWISQRVSFSPTAHNLLIEKGLMQGSKTKAFNIPKKDEPKAEAVPAPAPVQGAPAQPAEAPEPETPATPETPAEAPSTETPKEEPAAPEQPAA